MPSDYQKYINTQEGLERLRGNKKIYKTLLNSFLKKDMLPQLKNQLDRGDIETAAKTAHAIKGTAGNLSMPLLYEKALSFELELKDGHYEQSSYESLKEITTQTIQSITEVIATLQDTE